MSLADVLTYFKVKDSDNKEIIDEDSSNESIDEIINNFIEKDKDTEREEYKKYK